MDFDHFEPVPDQPTEFSEVNLPDDESPKFSLEAQEGEKDKNKYGEKFEFDPSGPYEATRTRTDFCWLIGFLMYLIVWIIVIIYAFSKGDMTKWQQPMDSNGLICGRDPEVYDKPYLMHYDNNTCELPGCLVCVSECHKGVAFNYRNGTDSARASQKSSKGESKEVGQDKGKNGTSTQTGKEKGAEGSSPQTGKEKGAEASATQAGKEKGAEGSSTQAGKEKGANGTPNQIASPQTNQDAKPKEPSTPGNPVDKKPEPSNAAQLPEKKTDEKTRRKRQSNAGAVMTLADLESTKENIYCRNGVKMDLIESFEQLNYFVGRKMCSKQYVETEDVDIKNYRCNVPEEKRWSEGNWRTRFVAMTKDLSAYKWVIIGFIALSGLIAIFSIFIMRWYTFIFICVSIFAFCALIFHYIYEKCVFTAESKTNGILLALFLCILILVGVVLVVIYFRKEIYLTCQMIEESVKAMTGVMPSLLVPLTLFILYMLTLTLGVNVYLVLTTLETKNYEADFSPAELEDCVCPSSLGYSQNATCEPSVFDSECKQNGTEKQCVFSGCYVVGKTRRSVGFLHFINYLGLCWSFWFVVGLNDIVLASVYSTWYWTFNKKILSYLTVLESFCRVSLYHLGTVAFGSLIILICCFLRAVLSVTRRGLVRLNKPFTNLILLNMQGVFDFQERLLNLTNKRAYVACALHGADFLHSARVAYYLVMRNVGRVFAVSETTSWITLMLSVVISWLTTRIAIGYFDNENAEMSSLPALMVLAGSFLIAYMFMRSVSIAVDTVYHCFLEDTERNDGSYEKPYFMSDGLTRFLYRK